MLDAHNAFLYFRGDSNVHRLNIIQCHEHYISYDAVPHECQIEIQAYTHILIARLLLLVYSICPTIAALKAKIGFELEVTGICNDYAQKKRDF